MKVSRSIPADDMIAEFLQAELHSSRFREGSLKALNMLGYNKSLLEDPDVASAKENQKRAKVLGLTRGWPNEWLFSGFPKDSVWNLATVTPKELGQCYRLKSRPDMAEDERLLATTAGSLKAGVELENIDSELIKQMVLEVKQQQPLPLPILAAEDFTSKKVLIEGHSRSIAYCVVDEDYLPGRIPVTIGISPHMSEWAYY